MFVSAQFAVAVLQGQAILLGTMTQRPASSTASAIVFACQRAIPNSMIPKTSASEREIVIAVSTAVAPSFQPGLEVFQCIAISVSLGTDGRVHVQRLRSCKGPIGDDRIDRLRCRDVYIFENPRIG